MMQVPQGGWFPLAIAAVVLCMTAIWHWGSLLRLRHSQACSARLVEDLLQDYKEHASTRCPLTACHAFAGGCFLVSEAFVGSAWSCHDGNPGNNKHWDLASTLKQLKCNPGRLPSL